MAPAKQILVIEDNEINRDMLTSILENQYTVLTAENGLAGLDILKDHPDDISLILLDIEMPVMDGYTFLDTIKSDEELSLIPVIVMTSSDTEEGEVDALIRGAADFLPKPYRPQIILHRVANIISLRENAALANQFKYDRLTGLYSKEYFCHMVREALLANPDEKYSIICSNIENFKVYNDNYGMKAGDLLLQDLAKAIRQRFGDNCICGRFSADRFLLLRKRFDDADNLEALFKTAWFESSAYRDNLVMKWGLYNINDTSVPIEHMCDRAFMAVDSISGQKEGYSLFPVSVNMSRATIYHEKLLDTLLHLTRKYDLEPSRLHLELTESAYTENPDQIIAAVKCIRDAGFIVEMDDFGSGYSSLNMLNQMKFDVLKLDMKFIQNETAKAGVSVANVRQSSR